MTTETLPATRPQGAMSTRQGADGTERKELAETAASSAAALAQATIQAAYMVADSRPRDWDRVRDRVLSSCSRPRFARESLYELGRKQRQQNANGAWETVEVIIRGLSVRFAEEAFREMGNLDCRQTVVYESDRERKTTIRVTDLESNSAREATVTVSKVVERKQLRKWEEAIEVRAGANNKVYIVAASEGDVRNKENAEISRAFRDLVLKLLPSDIKEEAREAIDETIASESLDSKRRAVRVGFPRLGIEVEQVERHAGCSVEEMSAAQLAQCIGWGTAIKSGETTWEEITGAQDAGEDAPADDGGQRAALVKFCAEAKASDAETYKASCEALGLSARKSPENLETEGLQMLMEEIQDRREGGE